MIVAIAAFFLVAGLAYEVAPASSTTLSSVELAEFDAAGRATREFLATFHLPGTPAPVASGSQPDFVVRDDDGVWRAAPVRIQ